jgi:hypothetical protein
MFSNLLSSLGTLRDFLSRAFFIAAFIPTLLFLFINALVAYIWSWPFHNWISRELLDATGIRQTVLFVALFFAVWIASYVVTSLTPLWIRTLEGQNWWSWLRDPGKRYHSARYQELSNKINAAVEIYARIQKRRPSWKRDIDAASEQSKNDPIQAPIPSPDTQALLTVLKKQQIAEQLIQLDDISQLYNVYAREIRLYGGTPRLISFSENIELLTDYAHDRAMTEHSRLLNERNMQFGDFEDIAPTAFGNVGQTAQAYAMRAFNCNLIRVWSALRRASEKDETASKALENCKSQLDFLVASYWFSLGLAVEWALLFSWYGEWLGAILSALIGPLICWLLWYGAAVEQYRLLQDLIVSMLNATRFQVLTDFHFGLPSDLPEERYLWRAIDFAIGKGELINLRYTQPKT